MDFERILIHSTPRELMKHKQVTKKMKKVRKASLLIEFFKSYLYKDQGAGYYRVLIPLL